MGSSQQSAKIEIAFWCCFYGSGVIVTLLLYGLLQERIMTVPYGGPQGSFFGDAFFLVFCNRAATVFFASVMIFKQGEAWVNAAPLWKYVAVSLSNVYASACQYDALKYVSFPVQMLGKSFKMMPVMLWGMAVSGKRYAFNDWMIAAAVTGGVSAFLLTGPIASHGDESTGMSGLLLLVVFLMLDGFTSSYQEQLFRQHQTSKYNQMFYINAASCLVSGSVLVLIGGFERAYAFGMEYPLFVGDAMVLSVAAVVGQWFIYSQVKEFGALVFAATMNIRQVVSILLSYITYGHSITSLQVVGLFTVFTALFYKSIDGFLNASAEKRLEKEPVLPKGVAKLPEA